MAHPQQSAPNAAPIRLSASAINEVRAIFRSEGNTESGWKSAPEKGRRATASVRCRANCGAAGFWAESNFEIGVLGLVDRLSDAGVRKSGPVETWGDHGEWIAGRFLRAGLEQWDLGKRDLRKLGKNDWRRRLIGHLIRKADRSFTALDRRASGHGNDSNVSRLCSRIDDFANQPRLSKHLKEIEARARQE